MPHLFQFLHKVNDKFLLIKPVLAMSALRSCEVSFGVLGPPLLHFMKKHQVLWKGSRSIKNRAVVHSSD